MAKREVGRPRVFSDEAIFNATAHTLARLGYGRLTLDAIAGELGCTRQALVRRFGSKHGLVRAYLEWVIKNASERYRAIRREHQSPLQALRARFVLPAPESPEQIADPSGQANVLSFFIGTRDDPEFRELLGKLDAVYHREVAGLLAEAQQQGEIREGNTAELAHVLIAVTTGEIVLWAANPSGNVLERIARVFDAVVAPYLGTLC
jgi:AcrR family transcriptional regulator